MPYSKIIICLLISLSSFAQLNYNGSKPRVFDLIKTELDLTPNWEKAQMNGKAHLELSPFFYPQSAVILDAKGFEIIGIKLNGNTWDNFTYDGVKLNIELDKTYEKTEKISLEINYVAKPNELTEIEGLSHPELKGLYFVKAENPIDRQLWTEGETEYNSSWFPTIDSPNEKHIQTIHLTVDSIYTTLSNGLLTKSENLPQGKRKDTWEQDKPHSVYLTMIAAGNFTKVIDTTFNDFEVSYYVEPTFASDAIAIFGHTPEMIRLFETQLGVKYPWQKYAQITVKEYISGAMENTSATILGAGVQKTKAQLIDTNEDAIIAHELFHHWFGDLVTCESWANLSLNEGFADYSEQLWAEHKYGKPEGEFTAITGRNQYFLEAAEREKEVIRYGYEDKEDMFDSHTYAKGGRIIHMLRRLVGEEAFWNGLNLYLSKHAYQTVEIHDLRLAMEEVTGLDLNWFFNQWFLGAGHPDLFVEHKIENGQLSLYVEQSQIKNEDDEPFQFPLEVLIGTKTGEFTKTFWVDESEEYFDLRLDDSLKYIVIDPSASLLARVDHVKSDELLFAQLNIKNSVSARMEAFDLLTYTPDDGDGIILNPIYKKPIRDMVLKTTEDAFWRLRDRAVQKLFDYDGEDFLTVEKQLQSVIKTDKKSQVRAK
jgi:aminopeptidase N